ncbi:MMPL family transporter [Planctomicrobium piriforme]|nr:MMPL family transporter [Planctomicrobium piriforme]
MFFEWLGHFVSRAWWAILLAWIALLVTLQYVAPEVNEVTKAGEFNFLPSDSPTRLGESLLLRSFPNDVLGSSVVVVISRTDGKPFDDADNSFIEDDLKPRLQSLMPVDKQDKEVAENSAEQAEEKAKADDHPHETYPEIIRVRTPGSREIGKLLMSDDKQSALVIVDTSLDLMDYAIPKPVGAVEDVVAGLKKEGKIPADLKISFSGAAVAGRDICVAQERSAHSIERWTLVLIVVLLLIVYRAPLPVLVPLITLVIAIKVAMRLLAYAAKQEWIGMFEGIEVYTVVVAYGAGVDFSMFLTSRFHEEIQRHNSVSEALTRTIRGVGPAVLAAAGTVIFGIGMMTFATFGKFHQAGISISFSLFVILCAAMTLTPSILRLMGRYTFWPEMPEHGVEFRTQEVGLFSRIVRRATFHEESHVFWERLASFITRYPVRSWLITVLIMFPWAIVGWWCYDHVSYGLIASLRSSAPSVQGTADISQHFSAGLTGPVTLVIEQPEIDFSSSAGQALVQELSDKLKEQAKVLNISDVRSVVAPLGFYHKLDEAPAGGTALSRILRRNAQRTSTRDYYVGEKNDSGSHATRLDIILNGDPFARESITKLNELEAAIRKDLPEPLRIGKFYLIGSTASIRDLEVIAGVDRVRINFLVTSAVFLVLMVLIRSLPDSVYLMATVIFSFLCTLGVSYVLFYALDPVNFVGLDWTVPTFLFTILVAVGQDYNIFLVTRIHEEREHHGPLGSVRHAVVQTAAIITSCGLIMAGTFSAMIVGGELARMTQLGFALAFGVLLDTMVVRPVLVPAYFAWRARREQNRHRDEAHPPMPEA